MNKRIKIEERGRSRTMTVQELILFSMSRAAMKGDLAAARTLFALKERYQDTDETRCLILQILRLMTERSSRNILQS